VWDEEVGKGKATPSPTSLPNDALIPPLLGEGDADRVPSIAMAALIGSRLAR
jgi:hypothetical protein